MIHDDPTPCFGRSDLFDATDLHSHNRAKELCGTCPAIDACRANLLYTRRNQIIAGLEVHGLPLCGRHAKDALGWWAA